MSFIPPYSNPADNENSNRRDGIDATNAIIIPAIPDTQPFFIPGGVPDIGSRIRSSLSAGGQSQSQFPVNTALHLATRADQAVQSVEELWEVMMRMAVLDMITWKDNQPGDYESWITWRGEPGSRFFTVEVERRLIPKSDLDNRDVTYDAQGSINDASRNKGKRKRMEDHEKHDPEPRRTWIISRHRYDLLAGNPTAERFDNTGQQYRPVDNGPPGLQAPSVQQAEQLIRERRQKDDRLVLDEDELMLRELERQRELKEEAIRKTHNQMDSVRQAQLQAQHGWKYGHM
ncbi:hypothetical protein EJ08DRAFT_731613 [Tothia fuscella]|uniref:Uncharacterized protein n=1 Tax=Tothia fuscella TaxID=1048955 RepID=A0A9P4U070_9PEZI|nr:hypothetical protein EJ08DRAFT_731613 [Tothia fuscella]